MEPEIHTFLFHGAPIRAHLSHRDALSHILAAGVTPANIPDGFNTVEQDIVLSTGETALAVCQRRFAPIASDNENEVNGWMLIVLADPAWSGDDAKAILQSVHRKIISS